MNRPAPYCTPSMLRVLKHVKRGTPEPLGDGTFPAFYMLQSRGWLDRTDAITDAGRKYLEGK